MKGCLKWALIVFAVLVVLFFLLAFFAALTTGSPKQSSVDAPKTPSDPSVELKSSANPPEITTSEAKPEKTNDGLGVSLEAFNAIENGMTYQQVRDIVGEDGEMTVDTEVAGITGQVYTWQRWTGANMIVQVQNGRVITKAQAGLR